MGSFLVWWPISKPTSGALFKTLIWKRMCSIEHYAPLASQETRLLYKPWMKLIVPYGLNERYLFRGFKLVRVLCQSQQSPKCTHSAAVPLCFKRHQGEGRRQNRKLLLTSMCYYCPPQTRAISITFMPDGLIKKKKQYCTT